jgi:hypothetical protein
MTDTNPQRTAVLSALSSPDWHPVPEAHGMPWSEAEALLDAYDASRAAASAPVSPAPADRAAILREAADRIDETRAPFPIAVQNGITWATAELRRHAAECPQCGSTGACNGGPCPLLRRLADAASGPGGVAGETGQGETCGRTWSIGGDEYPPCARPVDHWEAYCRSADGQSHFIGAADEQPAAVSQPDGEARS